MKLCELKEVLVGNVNIYERDPDFQEAERADGTTRTKGKYRDLYTGSWNMIPEELLQREVYIVSGGIRLTTMVVHIQLKEELGEGGAT